MKTSCLVPLLAALVIAQPAAAAPLQYADFVIPQSIQGTLMLGPTILTAGLSGSYEVAVLNDGAQSGALELFIIFTGAIDQTGQIVAPGFDCEVRHDSGINAAIRCTKPVLEPNEYATVIFQGRGQAAGTGKIGVVLNPSRSAVEADYDNNNETLNVTIQ